MTDIRSSRFQQLIRRAMAVTDRFNPSLIEDIMPVYPVEDPSDPHLFYDKDVRIVAMSVTVTSAVADFPVVDLGPTVLNSNAILDVLYIFLTNTPAGGPGNFTVEHNPNLVAIAPQAILSPTDGRLLKTSDSTTPGRSNWAFSGQVAGIGALPNNALLRIGLTGPGAGGEMFQQVRWRGTLYRSNYRFKWGVVNQTFTFGVLGLDRTVEPTEIKPAPGGGGPGP